MDEAVRRPSEFCRPVGGGATTQGGVPRPQSPLRECGSGKAGDRLCLALVPQAGGYSEGRTWRMDWRVEDEAAMLGAPVNWLPGVAREWRDGSALSVAV